MSSEIPGGARCLSSKNTSPCVSCFNIEVTLVVVPSIIKITIAKIIFPSLTIKFDKSICFQHNEENHRQVKNIFLECLMYSEGI